MVCLWLIPSKLFNNHLEFIVDQEHSQSIADCGLSGLEERFEQLTVEGSRCLSTAGK